MVGNQNKTPEYVLFVLLGLLLISICVSTVYSVWIDIVAGKEEVRRERGTFEVV